MSAKGRVEKSAVDATNKTDGKTSNSGQFIKFQTASKLCYGLNSLISCDLVLSSAVIRLFFFHRQAENKIRTGTGTRFHGHFTAMVFGDDKI